jgi:hypothetical protein
MSAVNFFLLKPQILQEYITNSFVVDAWDFGTTMRFSPCFASI